MKISDDGNMWIEYHSIPVTMLDAAGNYDSAVQNLDKPGRFVGGFVQAIAGGGINDNTQATAQLLLLDESAGTVYGKSITGVRVRVLKQAGTFGAVIVTFAVIVFLKK